MHRHVRLLLTTLAATTVLTAAVGSASAGRLSASNGRFRAVWSTMELGNSLNAETVRCAVTFEGSFHSATINKIRGAQIGRVTAASATPVCTGGNTTINRETLPWDISYVSFSGTLPNITSITFSLTRAIFTVETPTATCRAGFTIANAGREIANIGAGGRIEGVRADETATIPLTGGLCPLISGFFKGTGTFALLGTTTAVTIRLI